MRAARARSARASRGAPAPAPPPRAGGRPRSPAGRSRRSPSRRKISHSSRREPSLEPISVIWRAKRSIRSSSTRGPDEAPQMTRRPLFASAVSASGTAAAPTWSTTRSTPRPPVEAAHLLAPAGLRVVDDAVDARGEGALALRGGRGGRDHPCAREPGERDRGAPHSRSGRRHEHGLARPEAGAREQHVVRGEVHRPRRGGRLVRQAVGKREQVSHGRHDLLRIASVVVHAHHAVVGTGRLIAFEAVRAAAAREVVVDVDPGPRRDLRDAVSDLDHLTRDVVPGDDRERRAVRMADVLAHPDVEPVHGHGRDTDERLARPRRRGGAIDELQHLRPAVPLHDDRPHQ